MWQVLDPILEKMQFSEGVSAYVVKEYVNIVPSLLKC